MDNPVQRMIDPIAPIRMRRCGVRCLAQKDAVISIRISTATPVAHKALVVFPENPCACQMVAEKP